MPIDPRRCRPGELIRLMNSTPMGAVLTAAALRRHRAAAGLRIGAAGDPDRIDLFSYIGWLAGERAARNAGRNAGRNADAAAPGAAPPGAGAEARTLGASGLAAALGVHVNNIKYHVSRGMPYANDRRGVRRFNEAECRAWLVARGSVHYNGGNKTGAYAAPHADAPAREAAASDDPASPLAIELRLKLAKIDEIETKTAERKGLLVNAVEVRSLVTTHLAAARVAFDAVAVKAAARVLEAIEADPALHHAIAAAIRAEIERAMDSLAEMRPA